MPVLIVVLEPAFWASELGLRGLGVPALHGRGYSLAGPSTLDKPDPTKTFEKRALLSESQKIHHRIYGNDDFAWL